MAHSVHCVYCKKVFDRDSKEYVITGSRRYAHAECALRKAAEEGKPAPEVISPLDIVKCAYCGNTLNKKKEPYKKINTKYFHEACAELEAKREKTDKEKLEEYIMQLFNKNYVSPKIQSQINNFVEKYDYTYSGIHRSLIYWIEIKKHPYDTSYDSIGIVPKIYENAKNYFRALWLAQEKNSQQPVQSYKPKVVEIKIPPPQRNIPKRNLFSFLDEEEENNG